VLASSQLTSLFCESKHLRVRQGAKVANGTPVAAKSSKQVLVSSGETKVNTELGGISHSVAEVPKSTEVDTIVLPSVPADW